GRTPRRPVRARRRRARGGAAPAPAARRARARARAAPPRRVAVRARASPTAGRARVPPAPVLPRGARGRTAALPATGGGGRPARAPGSRNAALLRGRRPGPCVAGMRTALRAMDRRSVDFLVVGGGIQGAAIARELALRGADVLLVEKHDFAAGTSSRSS